MKKLKVVHISTYHSGGAGRAAFRIHEALLKNGVDSTFLTVENLGEDCSKNFSYYNELPATLTKPPHFIERQKNRIRFRIKKHLKITIKGKIDEERDKRIKRREEKKDIFHQFTSIRPSLNCEFVSLPFSSYNILENALIKDADIIHMHWVAGMLDYPSFFKENIKPIVWTLHDMNPFQGIFHYKEDEIVNKEKAAKLDQATRFVKHKAIENRISDLMLVTPSNWLLNEVKNSKTFKKIESYCIPYPINIKEFFPENNTNFKKINRIPQDNIVFLFVADYLRKTRKGFDLLIKALEKLKLHHITLLALGNSERFELDAVDIRFIGNITDSKVLRQFYSGADAVIIPSREDNLPNVMLESFACGTPVLSFAVGGFTDHIEDYRTGLKAHDISHDSLIEIIKKFILNKDRFKKYDIHNYAKKHFNELMIAEQYIKLYKQIFDEFS